MEGLVVNLINIYALISGPERLRFYQQASAFLSTLDPRKCLILGRDFNTTLEEWDHLGTEQCPATADVLREIVDHHSLVDIWRDQHPDNISKFTFVRVEAHQSHHSQLDHIYLSPRQWWDLGKVCAQLFCHDYTQGTSRWRDAAIEQLEREILELERRLAASTEDPPLCEACREKREELQALKDHRARGTFVQSHIHLLWKMDHGSCFFYTLEKRRGPRNTSPVFWQRTAPPSRIRRRCAGGLGPEFYAGFFSPDPTDPGACGVLWEELPTVSVGDRDRLELPLTLAEFSEALRRMPTNKSPGMDGLTVEFYRAFWDILGPDLVTVWAESLQGGVLPLSCRRAVLALLPKKGDLRDLRNWRPLSLPPSRGISWLTSS
ncbi:unnamed protein product [Caretta caretta]